MFGQYAHLTKRAVHLPNVQHLAICTAQIISNQMREAWKCKEWKIPVF